MTNLFKKAIVFSDLHLGLKSNSDTHNTDCFQFVQWLIAEAKKEGCETCFFLGDYHNNRASMNIKTMNYAIRCLELLNNNFEQVYFIPGNHDLFYRDNRAIQSSEWAKHLPNINIVNHFFQEGGVSIVPWLIEDEHKKIEKIRAKYMFGHFELPGYYMNASILMPDHGEIQRDHFSNIGTVYSGHFHKRQTGGNIVYIGNCFPHNYSDANDDNRGCMILEWDKSHEFRTWDEQPRYRVYNLSDLLATPDALLKPRMHVRVNLDINISYEEATFIKETFADTYNLREITLIPAKTSDVANYEAQGQIVFESVDQIVTASINTLDVEAYDRNLLLEIYRNL